MSFKMNGLDELAKELEQISKNAQALAGTHEYSFDEMPDELKHAIEELRTNPDLLIAKLK